MIRPYSGIIAVGFSSLLAFSVSAQSPFEIETSAADAVAGVPFPVRIAAKTPDGLPDRGFNNRLALHSYRRHPAQPVINEIAVDGETVEFINPGTDPVIVTGWELEAVQGNSDPVSLVSQAIPPMTLAPGGIFVWTSRTNEPSAFPNLIAAQPFNSPGRRVSAFQIRDRDGQVVDQVYFNDTSSRRTERRWTGLPLAPLGGQDLNWLRVGRGNRFNAADWVRGPGSLGAANAGLELPWSGSRIPVTVEPREIQLSNGVWSGNVTVAEAGTQLNLAVSEPGGPRYESELFRVLPVATDPVTGELPRLQLSWASESTAGVFYEANPEVRSLVISCSVAQTSNLVVRLTSDVPQEIAVSEQVLVPAGPTPEATASLTNFDDTLADGRAIVTVTATAPGFLPAQITLRNEDNESGRLFLQLPTVVAEDSGFQTEPGRVFLSQPAIHPVQVSLNAEGMVQTPAFVIVPAGASEAAFPLRVRDDQVVNGRGRTAVITAFMYDWSPAGSTVIVTDDESTIVSAEWPENLVEGQVAEGRLRLAVPRDHDELLTFQSDTDRFPAPAPVLVPAGSLMVTFPLPVPDNALTDGPFSAQICLALNGLWFDCRRLSIADDEVAPLTRLEFYPPTAVFSGQPFALQAFALDAEGVPQRTNFNGQLSLSVPTKLATVRPDSNPLSFTNSRFDGLITLEGTALGVQLDLAAAGLQQRSRPLDLIPGFSKPGPFYDLAVIPGRRTLLVSYGFVDGLLQELNPQTGSVERELALPHPATHIGVSDDGAVAWLASSSATLLRVDLRAWQITGEYQLDPSSDERLVRALAVLPGGTERVIAMVAPFQSPSSEVFVVAYEGGRRLPNPATIEAGTALNDIQPGRTSDEAFVGTFGTLRRVHVSADRVEVLKTGSGVGDLDRYPNFVLQGDQILTGEGRVLAADTLETIARFVPDGSPGWPALAQVVPLPEVNRVGFVDAQSGFRVFDRPGGPVLGLHSLPPDQWMDTYAPGRLVRCGERRIAQLLSRGGLLRVWESPWLETGTANLQIDAENPGTVFLGNGGNLIIPAQWQQRVVVTNQGPATAHGVELRISEEPPMMLGSMVAGESRVIERDRSSGQPEILRYEFVVSSGTPDPNPDDNSAQTETAVLAATRSGARVLALAMNHVISSPVGDRLYVALSRRPNGDTPGVAVVNPETAQIETVFDVGGEPKRLAVATNGNWLWALVESNRIARWNLTSATLESPLELGNDEVLDLLALPPPDGGLAVATRTTIQIFDGATRRGYVVATRSDRRHLTFAAGRLWAVRPGEIRSYQVTTSGLTAAGSVIALTLPSDFYRFSGDSQRLYFAGAILDIASRQLLAGIPGDLFLPEGSRSVVYGAYGGGIRRYAQDTLAFDADEPLPALQVNGADDLVRWGANGMAIRFATQLLMFSTPLVPEGVSDLRVGLSLTQPLVANEPFTATVTVTNRGPQAATRVQIRLQPQQEIQHPQVTPSEAVFFGGAWFLELANLPVGSETHFSVTGQLPEGGIGFAASAVAGATDPNPTDNTAVISDVLRLPTADLALTSLSLPDRIQVGEEFEAEVIVTNRGPAEVRGVSLDFSRRLGLQLLSATGGTIYTECCDGFFIVYSAATLAPGSSSRFTLRLVAERAGALLLSAGIFGSHSDSEPQNNQASHLVLVTPASSDKIPIHYASRLVWSNERQQFAATVDGQTILISKNLELDRILSVPFEPVAFAFSSDGGHLWIASPANRVLRLDLETGLADLDFAVPENLNPLFGAMGIVSDHPDLLVAAGINANGQPQVTAYDRGVPRAASYQSLHWQGNGVFLAISPERRVYVSTGAELRELEIVADGLAEVRNLDSGASYSSGIFSLAGNALYYGNGVATDLVTGSRMEPGISIADASTGLGYKSGLDNGFGPGNLTVQALDLATGEPVWRQTATITNGYYGQMVPMGTNGILFNSDPFRLVPAPAPETRGTDLELTASIGERVLGTNQLLTLNIAVTNWSVWSATGAILEVVHSAGVVPEPPSSAPLQFNLDSVVQGTNLLLSFRTADEGAQFIRATISSDLPDFRPADNSFELQFVTPPPPILLLADQTLGENGFRYPSPSIQASLTSPAPTDLEVEFAVEPVTSQDNDLTSKIALFHFNQGETRSRVNIIRDDGLAEASEKFRLTFVSGPVSPARSSALFTILDDDVPRFRPGTFRGAEGNFGISEMRLPVRLSVTSTLPVEVSFRLSPGTASIGTDFLARTGRLRFEPGTLTNFVSIPVVGDTDYEWEESLQVEFDDLSGALYEQTFGQVFLRNDDLPPVPVAQLSLTTGPVWQIRFDTVLGPRYSLQTRTNLNEGIWESVPETRIGSGEPATIEAPVEPGPTRWFRLLVE